MGCAGIKANLLLQYTCLSVKPFFYRQFNTRADTIFVNYREVGLIPLEHVASSLYLIYCRNPSGVSYILLETHKICRFLFEI